MPLSMAEVSLAGVLMTMAKQVPTNNGPSRTSQKKGQQPKQGLCFKTQAKQVLCFEDGLSRGKQENSYFQEVGFLKGSVELRFEKARPLSLRWLIMGFWK